MPKCRGSCPHFSGRSYLKIIVLVSLNEACHVLGQTGGGRALAPITTVASAASVPIITPMLAKCRKPRIHLLGSLRTFTKFDPLLQLHFCWQMQVRLPSVGAGKIASLLSVKNTSLQGAGSKFDDALKRLELQLSTRSSPAAQRLQSMVAMARGSFRWEKIVYEDSDCSESSADSDAPADSYALPGGLEVPAGIFGKLHPFQRDGIAWLWRLHLAQPKGCPCNRWLRAMIAEARHLLRARGEHTAARDEDGEEGSGSGGDAAGAGTAAPTPVLPFHVPLPGGAGGILADEMGLGKTVQVAAFLGGLFRSRRARACVVVAPLSLVDNWAKEIRQWAPGVRVAIYHGAAGTARKALRQVASKGGVLVTTYGTVSTRIEELREMADRFLTGPPVGERKEWKRGLVPGHDAFEQRWGGGSDGGVARRGARAGDRGTRGKGKGHRKGGRRSSAALAAVGSDSSSSQSTCSSSSPSSSDGSESGDGSSDGDKSGSDSDSESENGSSGNSDSDTSQSQGTRRKGRTRPGRPTAGRRRTPPLTPSTGFDWIICDEAHAAKNPSTKTAKALRALPARRRLLLTGTPLQNRTDELWALVDLACQGELLGPRRWFLDRVAGPLERARDARASASQRAKGGRASRALRAVLAPHMLRREKGPGGMSDVRMAGPGAAALEAGRVGASEAASGGSGAYGDGSAGSTPSVAAPPALPQPHKKELVLWCRPSSVQLALYRAFLSSPEARAALVPEEEDEEDDEDEGGWRARMDGTTRGQGEGEGEGDARRKKRGGQHDALVVLSALLRLCDHPLLLDSRGRAGVAIRNILPRVPAALVTPAIRLPVATPGRGDKTAASSPVTARHPTRSRAGVPVLSSSSESSSDGAGSAREEDGSGVMPMEAGMTEALAGFGAGGEDGVGHHARQPRGPAHPLLARA